MIFLIGPPVIRIRLKSFRIRLNFTSNRHKTTTLLIRRISRYEKQYRSVGGSLHQAPRVGRKSCLAPSRGRCFQLRAHVKMRRRSQAGGVGERLKPAVLKTVRPQKGLVGSNPTPSASHPSLLPPISEPVRNPNIPPAVQAAGRGHFSQAASAQKFQRELTSKNGKSS